MRVSPNLAVAGFTADYDKSGNKFFERHLHAECRSFLYPHSDPVGWAYDSSSRLLQFQRGIVHDDGNSIDTPLALAGVDSKRSYNLDATGNWVDDGFSGSVPAVLSRHDCHPDHQSHTTNNLNQIASVDGTSLSYDAKGNLLRYDGLSFTYDGFNRLITASGTAPDGSSTNASYYYDAMNRRLRKSNNGTTTDFVPFGSQVLEERDDADTLLRQFVWGQYVDELVQQREYENAPPGQSHADWYPLTDLLHRSVALTDDSVCQDTGGTGGSSAGPFKPSFVEVYDTDIYGRTKVYSAPGPEGQWFSQDDTPTFHPKCRRIYTGREYEPETGLHFFNARYYHPDLGRFLSRDPIFYRGGMNLYAYCGGMPGTNTDPSGNAPAPNWSIPSSQLAFPDNQPGVAAARERDAQAMNDEAWNRALYHLALEPRRLRTAADHANAQAAEYWLQQSAKWHDFILSHTPKETAFEHAVMSAFGAEPGVGESFIPVWGPFRAGVLRWEEAVYGSEYGSHGVGHRVWSGVRGVGDVGMAALDVFWVGDLLSASKNVIAKSGITSLFRPGTISHYSGKIGNLWTAGWKVSGKGVEDIFLHAFGPGGLKVITGGSATRFIEIHGELWLGRFPILSRELAAVAGWRVEWCVQANAIAHSRGLFHVVPLSIQPALHWLLYRTAATNPPAAQHVAPTTQPS